MNEALIRAAADAALSAWQVYQRTRTAARESGVITPEKDRELDLWMQERMRLPHWQPSSQR
jgi:hypothetical protein